MSEREKMQAGDWYSCLDAELADMRDRARVACHAHRVTPPQPGEALSPALADLFGSVGQNVLVEAPFHCAYGINIHLGDAVYINATCVILDSGQVKIGTGTMIGPGTHIYCADHHRDPAQRRAGIERALPVTIGADVWIGGGAIILPGVRIADGAIVGAGAVVTKDVAPGARVVGNPARVLP